MLKEWRDRHIVLRISYEKSVICYTYHPVHEDDGRPYLFYRGRKLNSDFIFATYNWEIAPPDDNVLKRIPPTDLVKLRIMHAFGNANMTSMTEILIIFARHVINVLKIHQP